MYNTKNLEEIKDEVAARYGLKTWATVLQMIAKQEISVTKSDQLYNEAAEAYYAQHLHAYDLTALDYFAARCAAGTLANPVSDEMAANKIAEGAYYVSAAMIEERKKYLNVVAPGEPVEVPAREPIPLRERPTYNHMIIYNNGLATLRDTRVGGDNGLSIDWLKIMFEQMSKTGIDPADIDSIVTAISGEPKKVAVRKHADNEYFYDLINWKQDENF